MVYLSEISKCCSIICLQEHWLYRFEIDKLENSLKDFKVHAKCDDDYEPIQSFQRPRGKGGVAILWHKNIDKHVKTLDEGSERIVCVEISSDPPTLLICSYLPTRGYKTSREEYIYQISILEAVVHKYQDTHNIVICSDCNASLLRDSNWDEMLKNFVKNCALKDDNISDATFIHHANKAKSKIDYVLFSDLVNMKHLFTLDQHFANTSSHIPIFCSLSIKLKSTTNIVTNKQCAKIKYLWDKADLPLYRSIIQYDIAQWMKKFENFELSCDIDLAIIQLTSMITNAAKEAVPQRIVKVNCPRFIAPKQTLDVLKESKSNFIDWSENGKPPAGDPTHTKMRESKIKVRQSLRQLNANKRNTFYEKLMENPGSREFHKMISYNRKDVNGLPDIIMKGDDEVTDPSQQAKVLGEHYSQLSTPSEGEHFDSDFLADIKRDNAWLNYITESESNIVYISTTEVDSAIHTLHRNKALDSDELGSEHIIFCVNEIVQPLTLLFNAMQKHKHIPSQLKSGYITSIPKKGKNPTLPSCHRGINITSVLGKVLEVIFKERFSSSLANCQDDLQLGFTKGLSPLLSALLITEIINEAKIMKKTLYIASLDAVKAFDTVSHDILFHSLQENGCQLDLYAMAQELYSGLSSKVVWKGYSSDEFTNLQGVQQGGVWSADLYKVYINRLLEIMRRLGFGVHIGDVYL